MNNDKNGLEGVVLGSLLLDSEALEKIPFLKPHHFGLTENRRIFHAIRALQKENNPIDALTVARELERTGMLNKIGGAYYLSQLSTRIGSTANIEKHSRLIIEEHVLRNLSSLSVKTGVGVSEGRDPFELIDELESGINELVGNLSTARIESLESIGPRFYDRLFSETPRGLKTHIPILDEDVTFKNGNLIIVAGRTGHGKTIAMGQFAKNQASEGFPVLYFNLEMPADEMMDRIVCNDMEFDYGKLQYLIEKRQKLIKSLKESDYKAESAQRQVQEITRVLEGFADPVAKVQQLPFYICSDPGLRPTEIAAITRKAIRQQGIKAIYIDYLQLVTPDTKHSRREVEVSYISKAFKNLAMELDIPVIVGCQVNRDPEKRNNKIPLLSDLRESGAIEQDADMVMFIVNGAKYTDLQVMTDGGPRTVNPNEVVLSIKKHRGGVEDDYVLDSRNCSFKISSVEAA